MIHAFKQIRLSGQNIGWDGSHLTIGSDYAYPANANPSGFITAAQGATTANLALTGSSLYNDIISLSGSTLTNISLTNASGQLSTNIFNSGHNLYSYLNTFSGNSQNFSTSITPTGNDNYLITYPLGTFSIIPKVQCTVEVSGNTMYNVNITGRTTSNFYAIFSDTIAESGIVLHSYCTINN